MLPYHLKILTPSSKVFEGSVAAIVVPGDDGYMGALANHAPIIANLSPGKLKVTLENGKELFYSISRGVLKIARNNAVLLIESVEELEEP